MKSNFEWKPGKISILVFNYNTIQNVGVCKIFTFLREVSNAQQDCNYLLRNSNTENITI